MAGWDNLSDAQIRTMPLDRLGVRLYLYTLFWLDRQTKPDAPEIDAALQKMVAEVKARGEN